MNILQERKKVRHSSLGFLILSGLCLALTTACGNDHGSQQLMAAEDQIPAAESSNSAIACVQSVCGNEKTFVHPFIRKPELEAEAKAKISASLRKPLQNYMGRVIHHALLVDQILGRIFESKPALQLPPEKATVIFAMSYLNQMNQNENVRNAIELTADGSIQFNREKLKAGLPQASEKELDAYMALNDLIKTYFQYMKNLQKPLELILKLFSPEKPYLEARQLLAISIQESFRSFEQAYPRTLDFRDSSLVLGKAQSDKVLTAFEETSFKNMTATYLVLPLLLNDDLQAKFKNLNLDFPKLVGEFKVIYQKSQVHATFRNPQTLKQILNTQVEKCFTNLVNSYGALPSEEQINQFVKLNETVQTTAREIVEERTQKTVGESLKLALFLPPSRSGLVIDFNDRLMAMTKKTEEMIKQLKTFDIHQEKDLSALAMMAANFRDETLLEGVVELCNQAKAPELNDSAYGLQHMINVSWPTVQYPQYGASILAHEIGHVVQANYELPVKPETDCLESKQETKRFVGEDFADLFAAEVMKRIGAKSPEFKSSNLACALYNADKTQWAAEDGLVNSSKTDVHSSHLYRLIAISATNSAVTPQCSKYLQEQKETRFNSYCRWKK